MPVDLGKVNAETMHAALVSLALGPALNNETGVITFGNNEWIDTKTGQSRLGQFRDVNEIKRAYSAQVVLDTAQQLGWDMEQTEPNTFEVRMQAYE